MNAKQRQVKADIVRFAKMIGVDPVWACAIAEVESAYGIYQKSPTGCRGVFQMSTIAMKDLLLEMERPDDEMIDICCGILFLRLLLKRHGSIEAATAKYCDPNDRHFYVPKVMGIIKNWGIDG
jgi:hypothetical protein